MLINPERKHLEDFIFEDFNLEGYDPHPAIKAPISI
jgi:thymidylate synthase